MVQNIKNRKAKLAQVRRSRSQRGFAYMLEAIIFMGFVVTVASMSISKYSGDDSKATSLYSKIRQYSDSAKRMRFDTQCYPDKTGAFFKKSLASTSHCGDDVSGSWKGPYAETAPVNDKGNIQFSELLDKSEIIIPAQFTDADLNGSGNSTQWVIAVTNVPAEIANSAMEKCNKGYTDNNRTTFKSGNCLIMNEAGTEAASSKYSKVAGSKPVTIGYVFDERS